MTTKITVVGLRRLGISFGLALKPYKEKITCTGYDPERRYNDMAIRSSGFARVEPNLQKAAAGADLLLLTLPPDQMEETLRDLKDCVKEQAQVVNTSLWHRGIDEKARTILPEKVSFISAVPVLNPVYLNETADKMEGHADLFKRGALLICASNETRPESIRMCGDLAQLIGAHAYFVDPLEADAYLTNVESLPRLLSAALMNAVSSSDAWRENSRMAGSSFFFTSGALQHLEGSRDLGTTILNSRDEMLRALDRVDEALRQLRTAVEQGDAETLHHLLADAQKDRADWLKYRLELDWGTSDGVPEKKEDNYSRSLFGLNKKD